MRPYTECRQAAPFELEPSICAWDPHSSRARSTLFPGTCTSYRRTSPHAARRRYIQPPAACSPGIRSSVDASSRTHNAGRSLSMSYSCSLFGRPCSLTDSTSGRAVYRSDSATTTGCREDSCTDMRQTNALEQECQVENRLYSRRPAPSHP